MKILSLLTATAALAAIAFTSPTAGAQTTATGHYEGTVLSVDRSARTFRLRDSERGTITIRVTNRTRFERVSGLSALRAGSKNIEATVRRSSGAWVASKVERSGGGGDHGNHSGGRDDNGGDRRGRGSDD
jgi:hypothetical protein